MEILLIAVVLGVITGAIASSRGRSFGPWFGIGLFTGCLGPFVALVVPRKHRPVPASAPTQTTSTTSTSWYDAPTPLRSPAPPVAPSASVAPPSASSIPAAPAVPGPVDHPQVHLPDLRGPARFIGGNPGSASASAYDAAVSIVYPILRSGQGLPTSDLAGLAEIAAAAEYLTRVPRASVGQGFESMRSLSIEENRKIMRSSGDSLVSRTLWRGLAGKGDDDVSVELYISHHCGELFRLARLAQLDLIVAAPRQFPTDPAFLHQVCNLALVYVMGVSASAAPVTEQSFAAAFQSFQQGLTAKLRDPHAVLGMMISGPRPPGLSEHNKLIRRMNAGRYPPEALAAMRAYLIQYRPAVQHVARVQQFMGWTPTTWDPVSAMPTR